MLQINEKSEIIQEVNKLIDNGFYIFLFCLDDPELLMRLCKGLEKKNNAAKVIQCMNNEASSDRVKSISKDQMTELLEIYGMYDFSDKITVVCDILQYGTLLNYVKNGIITKEEMVDALLYNI